jgi:tyrosine-protein phosphatase SIW14
MFMVLYRWRIAVIVMLLCAGGCSTVGKSVPGINNFAEVEKDVLYRGAQPSERGIEHLADQGVKTVVNLRADPLPWEKDAVTKAGMNYVWIPSLAEKTDPAVVRKFLATVRERNQPVFVHCRVGRDRTGLNCAAYRIVEQGWSRPKAIRELHEHGYHWAWFPGIERYLKSFDEEPFKGG